MRDNTHVPDKLEGYLLQTRHALFELISFDSNRVVSVEAYDDVASEGEEVLVAQQLKSVLSTNNPLSDRAIELWKAIYNWSRYITPGSLGSKELQLKFVIVASHELRAGNIASAFHNATDIHEAKSALEMAKLEIYGTAASPQTKSKTLESYITYCFAKENETAVLSVIQSFTIDLHNGDYDNKLSMRELTLQSFNIGMAANLFSMDFDTAYVFPLTQTNRLNLCSNTKRLLSAAEKLGIWCAELNLLEICNMLKVRF